MTTTPTADATRTVDRALLTLDTRHPTTRAAVTDVHLMHRLVMSGYQHLIPAAAVTPRADLNVLYTTRVNPDSTLSVLVQADQPGQWDTPAATGPTTSWKVTLPQPGRPVPFQITAAPTRNSIRTRTVTRPRRPITDPTEQLDWLHRQATRSGFAVAAADIVTTRTETSATKSKARPHRVSPNDVFKLNLVTYTGLLTVTDPERFATAAKAGIGPGRAYGAGLILTR